MVKEEFGIRCSGNETVIGKCHVIKSKIKEEARRKSYVLSGNCRFKYTRLKHRVVCIACVIAGATDDR